MPPPQAPIGVLRVTVHVAPSGHEAIDRLHVTTRNTIRMQGVQRIGDSSRQFRQSVRVQRLSGDAVLDRPVLRALYPNEGLAKEAPP